MRAALALALGVGAAMLLYRANARAAAVDNPDPVSFTDTLLDFVPDLPTFDESPTGGAVRTSDQGIERIKSREGFSATRYPDAGGYSIGYGHFIKPGEFFSEPMSEPDATSLLYSDLGPEEGAVTRYVTIPLTQNQFDALVSFVHNVGISAFRDSTLLKRLNSGDIIGAANELDRWTKSEGVTLQALVDRRADEKAQFLS